MTKTVEFEVGATIGGHTVDRKEPLEHLRGTYYELTHQKTGARHLHLAVPDDNNAFGVVFPTVPKTGNGVPHILEHTALMGSQKYQVKDPFFAMIPRSLQTFINASTSDDATTFLYSTRNEKDYFNLLSVYLDASFFPLLRELSFKQDGHRLEYEVPDDPASGLQLKGVVFNEMKGYMATPVFTALQAIGTALYPDLTYGVNAGGDPAQIPDLTWEELKQFHATHYHPSNSYFITYGNIPLEKTLEQVESDVLSKFVKITPDVEIRDQKRFEEPREFRAQYPLSKEEDLKRKTVVIVGWLTTYSSDSFEMFALHVLNQVLLGNAASRLHKALIDSGLGDALADFTGLRTDYKEAAFLAGIKGADATDAGKIEALILETLENIVKEGIDQGQVDAAIHQLEIDAREITNRGYPYGIRMIYGLQNPLFYGGDPYQSLQFDKDIERLQEARKAGTFFEDLIRKYFLDNSHRVRIIVEPDQEREEKLLKAENDKLAKIESSLTEADRKKILEDSKALKNLQESQPDIAVLPTLELSDIPMDFEVIQETIEEIGGARVGLFSQPTNGLTYIDLAADFSSLDDRLKDWLALFGYALTQSGAGASDYLQLAERIDSYTGGIGAGASARAIAGKDDFRQMLVVSGKALARNHKPFVAILKDIFSAPDFTPKRLKDLIAQLKAQYDTAVSFNGLQFAMSTAAAKLSAQKQLEERLGGLRQYTVLKELAQRSEDELADVIVDLNAIKDHLFRSGGLQICVTTDEKNFPEVRELLEDALKALPQAAVEGKPAQADLPKIVHEAKTIAVPVAYNARVVKTVEFTHADAPALLVLSQHLSSKYFIRELREKRGAYGAQALFAREGGYFMFITSQDPNIAGTFDIFKQGVAEIIDNGVEPADLKEAILSACGAVDPLSSPDTKGRTRFFGDLAGYTLALQKEFKKKLLEVTEADVRRVAKDHLLNEGAMATVSNPDKVEEANQQMGGIFEVSAI